VWRTVNEGVVNMSGSAYRGLPSGVPARTSAGGTSGNDPHTRQANWNHSTPESLVVERPITVVRAGEAQESAAYAHARYAAKCQ